MESGSTTAAEGGRAARDPAAAIADNPLWYHTIEIAPGVVTPGWFDLRPIVDELPWPDVNGKRCLDVGTADGFLAFELERRGAAEVVATDVSDHELWDFPVRKKLVGAEYLRTIAGPKKGVGFEIARELLGSSVTLKELSVYDLGPDQIGKFDVVVCGSLLLHLRDPLRGLAGIKSVCRGQFMSTNQVELRLSLRNRRLPLARLEGLKRGQWWLPNAAGHKQMLLAAGFDVERETGIYSIPYGTAHPSRQSRTKARDRAGGLGRRLVTGNDGVPHHALLAQPAV